MKVLVAPAQFKETVSAVHAAKVMAEAARSAGCHVKMQPVSDGGEGFLDPFLALGGEEVTCGVNDPLLRNISASYVLFQDKAIIEMARASGIELVAQSDRDIWQSGTYGTGQLIRDALNKNVQEIIISLGGSATNDGGMGMMRALDVQFYSDIDKVREFAAACRISKIELSKFNKLIDNQVFTGACDVTNPLLGEQGATYIYSEQKGASDEDRRQLEKVMQCYAAAVRNAVGMDCALESGSGAAGGTGFALKSFFGATLSPGFDILSETVGLRELMKWADVVITGEGKMDHQTGYGKAPSRLREMAVLMQKPVAAIVGKLEKGLDHGFDAIYSLTELAGDETKARMFPDRWIGSATKLCIEKFKDY
ncbi:MAG: glycerate kinase [Cyclobacteriaceae bacterium]